MESSELLSKSIFDMIEDRSEAPIIFAWSRNAVLFTTTPEILLFEGELMTMQKNPFKLRSRKYVLTINALIRYKVLFKIHLPNFIEIRSNNSQRSFEAQKPTNREN